MMTLSVSPETVVFNNYQDWEVTACTYTPLSLKELSLIFSKNCQQSTISQETQNIMSKSLGGSFYCNFFREKHWLFIFKHFFPLTSLSPKKIRHLWMSYVIKTIYATLWFFFFPVLFILWSNLLQHLQDSHQQNTIFFGQSWTWGTMLFGGKSLLSTCKMDVQPICDIDVASGFTQLQLIAALAEHQLRGGKQT